MWWDTQSDYNISHFTRRCEEPLRLVWWGPVSLIIISLTSPVGARRPCDRCGRDPQSDYNISHFTRRCEEPLRLVW